MVIKKDDYLFTENPNCFTLPVQSHKMYSTTIRNLPINGDRDIFDLRASAESSYQR
jgi:hypothetical protein